MTAFPKTPIHSNRKSRSAFKRKVETGRKTEMKDVKIWEMGLI